MRRNIRQSEDIQEIDNAYDINKMKEQLENAEKKMGFFLEKNKKMKKIREEKKVAESQVKDNKEEKKSKIKISTIDSEDLVEAKVFTHKVTIILSNDEYKISLNNSKSYVIIDKPKIRIIYKNAYMNIKRMEETFEIITNQKIRENSSIEKIDNENGIYNFEINNLNEIMIGKKEWIIKSKQINKENLEDNQTLLISQEDGKVYLPYKIEELKEKIKNNGNNISLKELIEQKYVYPISKYKNTIKSRYEEAYKLMRKREGKSIAASIMLGIELMFEFSLHPAIISACKNLEELDIYLDCLDENELDKFSCFKIVYKALPMLNKAKKMKPLKQ